MATQAISCGPREALYVLDGLLRNNTILKIRQHTTDTHGYTEIIFALCHLLGFYFMPRIRDLKDQQLYRVNRLVSNAILYWNTLKINDIVESLRAQGEILEDKTLDHISLLPYRHVIPNGAYFVDYL